MTSQGPLRLFLICPDLHLRAQISEAVGCLPNEALISYTSPGYPSGTELARALRTYSPHAVFLSFENPEVALEVMKFLESEADGLPVVAINAGSDTSRMRDCMRSGVREFMAPPFSASQVTETLQAVRQLLRQAPLSYVATEHIYSFLPAKPGSGTSVVALNISAALARQPGQKVMLADLDLTCGMIGFFLKLPHDLSIVDAMTRSAELDVAMWPQLVTHLGGLDVLHSGTINPQAYLEPEQVQGLVDFARANYNALFFDLSGNFERHSLQIMQESRRVFLVCSPDPASLALGRDKLAFLKTLGLESKVSIIVNRADQPMAVAMDCIAEVVGARVLASFPDDEGEVHAAIQKAQPVNPKSPLGQSYAAFAERLVSLSREEIQEDAEPTKPDLVGGLAA